MQIHGGANNNHNDNHNELKSLYSEIFRDRKEIDIFLDVFTPATSTKTSYSKKQQLRQKKNRAGEEGIEYIYNNRVELLLSSESLQEIAELEFVSCELELTHVAKALIGKKQFMGEEYIDATADDGSGNRDYCNDQERSRARERKRELLSDYNRLMSDPEIRKRDPHAYEVFLRSESEMKTFSKAAEHRVQCCLERMNIMRDQYKTEDDQKADNNVIEDDLKGNNAERKTKRTPDILFNKKQHLFDTEICWIEVKAHFDLGITPEKESKSVENQLKAYCDEFGPGAVVFTQYGFFENTREHIKELTGGRVLVLRLETLTADFVYQCVFLRSLAEVGDYKLSYTTNWDLSLPIVQLMKQCQAIFERKPNKEEEIQYGARIFNLLFGHNNTPTFSNCMESDKFFKALSTLYKRRRGNEEYFKSIIETIPEANFFYLLCRYYEVSGDETLYRELYDEVTDIVAEESVTNNLDLQFNLSLLLLAVKHRMKTDGNRLLADADRMEKGRFSEQCKASPKFQTLKGRFYLMVANCSEAFIYFNIAASALLSELDSNSFQNPDALDAYCLIGDIYIKENMLTEAKQHFELIVSNKKFVEAAGVKISWPYEKLAGIYMEEGAVLTKQMVSHEILVASYEKAKEYAKKSLCNHPANVKSARIYEEACNTIKLYQQIFLKN